MSEFDLLRKIADLEARLARLESAGAPYTTTSAGAMTTPALNVGSATGATTGMIKASGNVELTATSSKIKMTRNSGALALDALWYGNDTAPGSTAGDYLWIGASNGIEMYGWSAVARIARFTTTDTTIDGGLNLGTATGAAAGAIALQDGITAPSATAGAAKLYVDTADGDLKIIFGDGTVKTIATDT